MTGRVFIIPGRKRCIWGGGPEPGPKYYEGWVDGGTTFPTTWNVGITFEEVKHEPLNWGIFNWEKGEYE